LKATYNAIQYYKSLSGFSWDEKKGANISTPAEEKAWEAFIAVKVNLTVILI